MNDAAITASPWGTGQSLKGAYIASRGLYLTNNIVTRGVRLDGLIGEDFKVGSALLRGVRRCRPVSLPRVKTRPGLFDELRERGGRGVCVREDMPAEDDECQWDRRFTEPHEEGCPATEEQVYEDGLQSNDVFIVEGQQERYGSKGAWTAC